MGLNAPIPEGIVVYEFIKQELKRQIENGTLQEGQRVPSELELAGELGVSRGQTRQALRDLEMAGYLLRSPGRGSFVAPVSNRAKHLGVKGFRMVAMAASELDSVYRRRLIESFSQSILDTGFRTLTYFLGLRDDRELEFLEKSRKSDIEGLAFWIRDRSEAAKAVFTTFFESEFPFVLCDRYLPDFETDFVVTDNVDAAYRLTRGLIEQGHRHIAFMTLWFGMTPTEDRFTGYRKALDEAGLPFEDALVGSFDAPGETAGSILKEILACRHRPTAIFAADDRVVRASVEVLRQLRYRLPDDMAFASVDDDDSLQELGFPILFARQNAEEIGRQTAELLAARIENRRKDIEKRFVKMQFIHTDEAEAASSMEAVSSVAGRASADANRKGGDSEAGIRQFQTISS